MADCSCVTPSFHGAPNMRARCLHSASHLPFMEHLTWRYLTLCYSCILWNTWHISRLTLVCATPGRMADWLHSLLEHLVKYYFSMLVLWILDLDQVHSVCTLPSSYFVVEHLTVWLIDCMVGCFCSVHTFTILSNSRLILLYYYCRDHNRLINKDKKAAVKMLQAF